MKRFHFMAAITLATALVTAAETAQAQGADDWTFATTPPGGQISGDAGTTIGWGYTIQNLSSTYWLFVTDVNSDTAFQHGTATSTPFDDPILAPNTTTTVDYDGFSGLVDLTWDSDAPDGFVNAGNFIVSASYYDDDRSMAVSMFPTRGRGSLYTRQRPLIRHPNRVSGQHLASASLPLDYSRCAADAV